MTPAALAVATAFNLLCTGTTFYGPGSDYLKKENQAPYTQTFRIDLKAERWCSGACQTTDRIYQIGQTRIMLKLEQDEATGSESFISLSREDGSLLDRTKVSNDLLFMNTGKCSRVAFTGFPARQF